MRAKDKACIFDSYGVCEKQCTIEKKNQIEKLRCLHQMDKSLIKKAFILFLGSLIYAVGYYDRNCTGVLTTPMSKALNVTTSDMSIVSSTYFWSYAVVQPFIGSFADLIDTSYITSSALMATAIGSAICGVSRNFYVVCIARFFVGLGCGCIYVPICRTFAQWFTARSFPYAQSFIIACGGMGGFISQNIIGTYMGGNNWPLAFFIGSGLSLFLSVLAFFFMTGSIEGRVKSDKKASEVFRGLFENIKEAITMKDFWLLSIWKFLTPSSYTSLSSNHGMMYLKKGLGFNQQKASRYISITSLTWTIGSPIMAVTSNWIHTRKWLIVVSTLIATGTAIGFAYITSVPSNAALLSMLVIFSLFSGASLVVSAITFKEMRSKKLVGTMMGCGNFCMLVGTSIQQGITTAVIKNLGPTLFSFRMGLWVLSSICCGLSIFGVCFIKDTYRKVAKEIGVSVRPESESLLTGDNNTS